MVSFKLFAGTNIGLRENNEDNFTVCPDLTKNEWIVPADNQPVIQLGSKGCIMVVADGMGGQNAGEVASAIAIDTVQEMFSSNRLPADVLNKPDAIKLHLRNVISECDTRIKNKTKDDVSTYGMGSTIIIAWLLGRKLYIAWLGDSRAYSYVEKKGIARLSKDHSFVQQLVDAGTISEEEAMDHPNSNIITRSLGDTSQKAKADVAEYDIEDGQVVLLCSDGLCGVCQDAEIGGIIEEAKDNLQNCKDRLVTAALAAGGSDNITIALLKISVDPSNSGSHDTQDDKGVIFMNHRTKIIMLVIAISLLLFGGELATMQHSCHPKFTNIKLTLDKSSLNPGDSTKYSLCLYDKDTTEYHICLSNKDTAYKDTAYLDFNSSLLDIKHNMIMVKDENRKKDTTINIIAICKLNTTVCDTIELTILKNYYSVDTIKTDSSLADSFIVMNGEFGVEDSSSSDKNKDQPISELSPIDIIIDSITSIPVKNDSSKNKKNEKNT